MSFIKLALKLLFTNDQKRYVESPRQKVFVKRRWEDDWNLARGLWCKNLRYAAGPAVSSAEFEWKFGEGKQAELNQFAVYPPVDVLGWFVKIEAEIVDARKNEPHNLYWLGVFEDDVRRPGGILSGKNPSGTQMLHAFGLEAFLERRRVTDSVTHVPAAEKKRGIVRRGLPFNGGVGDGYDEQEQYQRGNRAPSGYLFSDDVLPDEALEWTAWEAAAYLVREKTDLSFGHDKPPPPLFALPPKESAAEKSARKLLGNVAPRVETDGRTVAELLARLIDRRRLVGYCWVPTPAKDTFFSAGVERMTLNVFSFANSELKLLDDSTVPANTQQKALTVDRDVFVKSIKVARRAQHAYHVVKVRGARRTATGTFRQEDESLASLWESEQEEQYAAGGSEGEDYPEGDTAEDEALRDEMNAAVRGRDNLAPVFCHFGPDAGWDEKLGSETAKRRPLFPVLKPDGKLDAKMPSYLWRPGARFLSWLPLLRGVDYSTGPDAAKELSKRRGFLGPFVLYQEDDDNETHTYLDRRNMRQNHAVGEEQRVSAGLRPLDREFGVEIKAHGQPQDVFAGSGFTPLEKTSDAAGQLDWQRFLLTAAVEHDEHVEVSEPPMDKLGEALKQTEGVEKIRFLRELVIDMPDARLDWVAHGTIYDLDDAGKPLLYHAAAVGKDDAYKGFVRDDRPRMQRVAKLAFQWYAHERQTLDATFHGILPDFAVGQLISQIGAGATLQKINTVVTSVLFDFDQVTTSIQTDYAEFDPR